MSPKNNLQPLSTHSNGPRTKVENNSLVIDRNENIDDVLQPVSKEQEITVTLPNSKNHTLPSMLKDQKVLAVRAKDDSPQEQFELKNSAMENEKKKETDVPSEKTKNSFDGESIDDVKINVSNKMMLAWSLAVRRVENGQKINQQFENFFKEIVKHEEAYCRSLKNLCLNFTSCVEKENKNLLETVVVLSRNMLHRSEQAHDLAKNIQQDVLDSTLSLANRDNSRALQQIVAHCTLLDTELRTTLKQYSEIHESYLKTKESIKIISEKFQMLRYYSRQNPFDRITLATKLLKRIQEFYSLEKSLERHKEASHKSRLEYEIKMRHILNSLRDIDVKRASCLKDAIGKYMVYQTSALRNMQYDMDVTIQSIIEIPDNTDLQELLESTVKENEEMSKNNNQTLDKLSNKKPDICLTQTRKLASFPDSNNFHTPIKYDTQIESDIDTISQLNPIEKASRVACDFFKNNRFHFVIQTAVNHLSSSSVSNKLYPYTFHLTDHQPSVTNGDASPVEHTANQIDAQALSNKPNFLTPIATRLKLCDHYHQLFELIWNVRTQEESNSIHEKVEDFRTVAFYPSHRQAFVNELSKFYLAERYLLPSPESLGILGVLTDILLSICDHHWDIDTARALMILCQAFYVNHSLKDDTEIGTHVTDYKNSPLMHTVPNAHNQTVISDTCGAKFDSSTSLNLNPYDDLLNEMFEKRVQESSGMERIDKEKTTIHLYRLVYNSNMWNRVRFWKECLILTIAEIHQARWMEKNNKNDLNNTESHTIIKQTSPGSDTSILYDTDGTQSYTYNFPSLSMLLQLQQNFGVCMLLYGIMDSYVINLITNVEKILNLPSNFTQSLLSSLETYTRSSSQEDARSIFPPFAPRTS